MLVAELDTLAEFPKTVNTCPLESVIVLVSRALACDDVCDRVRNAQSQPFGCLGNWDQETKRKADSLLHLQP